MPIDTKCEQYNCPRWGGTVQIMVALLSHRDARSGQTDKVIRQLSSCEKSGECGVRHPDGKLVWLECVHPEHPKP